MRLSFRHSGIALFSHYEVTRVFVIWLTLANQSIKISVFNKETHIYRIYLLEILLKFACYNLDDNVDLSIKERSSDSKRYRYRLSNPIFENLWFVNRMFLQAVNIFYPILFYDSYLLVTKFARDIRRERKGEKNILWRLCATLVTLS